jgi:lysophospholipase L1-like esterase
MPTKLKSGDTLLCIGDSITDCGRRGPEAPLGGGYVKLLADLLAIREPEKTIRLINKGIGGDNVLGLQNRWSDDVLRHRPDWLSVKIGINDLHTVLRGHADPIAPERFAAAYDDILGRTRKALPACRLLLITPFYISSETSANSFRRQVLDALPAYIRVVEQMSRRHRTRLVRTHDLFQRLLKSHEADRFCPEPVHPNLAGHLAIAEAVYDALA